MNKKEMLDKIKIDEFGLAKIKDEEEVSKLETLFYAKKDLPNEVVAMFSHKVVIVDIDDLDLDNLPWYISSEPKQITDKKEIEELIYQYRHKGNFPENIERRDVRINEYSSVYEYYDHSRILYFKDIYGFYVKRIKSDEEIVMEILVKQTEIQEEMNHTLNIFKVVLFTFIFISILLFVIFIIGANT